MPRQEALACITREFRIVSQQGARDESSLSSDPWLGHGPPLHNAGSAGPHKKTTKITGSFPPVLTVLAVGKKRSMPHSAKRRVEKPISAPRLIAEPRPHV
ncbi:hypothetical protein MYCTH_2125197 [Thermothelomyces thermophilus ATCC 42464]|uniref:Uncharacterized protein n=1 Tax=Thermothelomyces thermophilus (strain ATCC 42464 / BCRC 31852 / DSM 1799) TaxID=573729 RepID=G2Q8I5_THET4|nr:uncharacterized protein MYCTH_2125197 [Thermothelomyces thermophilus ATCC 42464]AEO56234.1 hypothetical protein MYCTH_2125197 [Thermothelomyces thermophilus ATCC 42464]